jgi:mono/diheme cytochrome c family protein
MLLAAVTLFVQASTAGDSSSEVEQGRSLYRLHCRTCHGMAGKGDGPATGELTPRPADLTRLRDPSSDDPFPRERVYRVIDGREELPAHGSRQMPIWGFAFQQLDLDTDQEGEVRRRIETLVRYLESIQTDDER